MRRRLASGGWTRIPLDIMPAARIYIRVSSEAQIDGTSLATQSEACRACAERLGLAVVATYADEGKSAKTTVGRDALLSAVAACQTTGDALVVYKFDRLARNLGDAYTLRDMLLAKHCRIISATEGEAVQTPVSRLLYSLLGAVAEFDNAQRAERCRAGLHARAAQGGWCGGVVPVGYLRGPRDPASHAVTLLADERLAPIVSGIFKGVATGRASLDEAVRDGARTLGISRQRVRRMLSCPAYAGMIAGAYASPKNPIEALWPAIVPADIWQAVQTVLIGGRRRLAPNPDFPLVRIARCPVCHEFLRAGYVKGRGRRYGYYWCVKPGHFCARRDALTIDAAGIPDHNSMHAKRCAGTPGCGRREKDA